MTLKHINNNNNNRSSGWPGRARLAVDALLPFSVLNIESNL